MDEFQINSFISEVRDEMELIRVFQNEPVELTVREEKIISKHKKSEQSEVRKKLLSRAEERKRERVMLLIMAIEDKLLSANLPEKVKTQLANVLDKVKNNQITITTEIDKEIRKIEEAENEEKKPERTNESGSIVDGLATAAVATTAVLIATGTIASVVATKEPPEAVQAPEPTITTVAGVPILSKYADPVVAEKVIKAGNKALSKLEKELTKIGGTGEITLAKINNSNLSGMERKVASAAYLSEHEAEAKDLANQEVTTNQKAIDHAIVKQRQEKEEKKLARLKREKRDAKTQEEKDAIQKLIDEQKIVVAELKKEREKFAVKRDYPINKAEQKAHDVKSKSGSEKVTVAEKGKKMVEPEREREKVAASVSHSIGAVIDQAKLDELTKQRKELNATINRTKNALKVAKTDEERKELQEKLDKAQTSIASVKDEIRACYNRPQYDRKHQIGAHQIKMFRERLGVAATPQEVIDGMPNPAKEICTKIIQEEHPEAFQNQVEHEKERMELAKIRAQRKVEEKRRLQKISKEKGKVTDADRKRVHKEVCERFNPTLKQFLVSHQQPVQQAAIAAQMVNQRGAA